MNMHMYENLILCICMGLFLLHSVLIWSTNTIKTTVISTLMLLGAYQIIPYIGLEDPEPMRLAFTSALGIMVVVRMVYTGMQNKKI